MTKSNKADLRGYIGSRLLALITGMIALAVLYIAFIFIMGPQ